MPDSSALQGWWVCICVALVLIFVATSGGAAPAAGTIAETPWSLPLPPGRLTLGAHAGDQQVETSGDMLIPVFLLRTDLLFINPRGAWSDNGGEEFNLGLGARHLFPDKNLILGGNVFYDRRTTALDNTFNQVGIGVELISIWIDARLNGYLPEHGVQAADDYIVTSGTTREQAEYWYAPAAHGHTVSQAGYAITEVYDWKNLQHYQTKERAMSGFDAEIGSRLPIPVVMDHAEVKAFVGYYEFNAPYGDETAGVKARLEVRPVSTVCLDVSWYGDEELLGSRYSIGFRATIPFDLARLSRGANPFAGALDGLRVGDSPAAISARMTEMVVRDLHVRTDVSEPREIVEDRRQLTKTMLTHERRDYTEILASDVTFVSGDNRSGTENGTWETPYRQINAGVQNAIGAMVYVDKAGRDYHENVVLRDGITLWGSGAPLCGSHGVFQGGRYPVVNGGGEGPAITLANKVRVIGFELVQPAGSPVASPVIYGGNVSGVTLADNLICGNGAAVNGIALSSIWKPALDATLWHNRVTGAREGGILVSSVSVPDVNLVLAGNTVTGNGGDGVLISAVEAGDFRVRLSGRYSENGGVGVNLAGNPVQNADVVLQAVAADRNGAGGISVTLQSFSGTVAISLFDITANANSGDGVCADIYGYHGVAASFGRITAGNNLSAGIQTSLVSGGMVRGILVENRLDGNGADGLSLDLNSGLDSWVVARGNHVAGNAGNGMLFATLAPWDSLYDFGAAEPGLNSFYGNEVFQVIFNGPGTLSAAGNWWGTPLPLDEVDFRDIGGGLIETAPALAHPPGS